MEEGRRKRERNSKQKGERKREREIVSCPGGFIFSQLEDKFPSGAQSSRLDPEELDQLCERLFFLLAQSGDAGECDEAGSN